MATEGSTDSAFDIDSPNFNSEAYLDRLFKFSTLNQITDKEAEIILQSQNLQSEMQTLVYENYNKFISATDTVAKMKSDFKTMQMEMIRLCDNMEKITKFSENISNNLKESGSNVSKLCSTRHLLDRLQFLFLLPSQLNKYIEQENYSEAVNEYTHAQRVLQKYGGQPSFQGIQVECEEIISNLKIILKNRLNNYETSVTEVAESIKLLVQLNEPEESLNEVFLICTDIRMKQHFDMLNSMMDCVDILQWVEKGNELLINDLNIVVTSYYNMFDNVDAEKAINNFVSKIMDEYFVLSQKVLSSSCNLGTNIVVRALDKFFRHLQAMGNVFPFDVSNKNKNTIIQTISMKGEKHCVTIKNQFKDNVMRVRQSLATKSTDNNENDLKEIFNMLLVLIIDKIEAALVDLLTFLQQGLSFSLKPWCIKCVSDTCWKIIYVTMENIADIVKSYSILPTSNNTIPFELLLILAKLCLELQENGVAKLHSLMVKLLEEASPGESIENHSMNQVNIILSTAAQAALDAEVVFIGQTTAQMLRVSVLARDWLKAPEPRGPRAVCRRVVEALASADAATAQLFKMGPKQSSDSSRRTLWSRTPSTFSTVNRLFSERIEVFGPAGADRAALSNGTLKIALKALVECVRLRTFGRHGLQQLQVDIHFLHQRLSCTGNDERLLTALLEDAMASAQLRCVDPQLMEPSIVDVICERG